MRKLVLLIATVTMVLASTMSVQAAHGPNVVEWSDLEGYWSVHLPGFVTHYLGEQGAPAKRLVRSNDVYRRETFDCYAYGYDANGNLTNITDISNHGGATTYQYDGQGRITRKNNYSGSGVLNSWTTCCYNEQGQLIRETAFNDQAPDGEGYGHTSYIYENGRIVRAENAYRFGYGWSNSTTTFSYDANGNLIEERNSNNWWNVFEYDQTGRMIKGTSYRNGSVESYVDLTYDKDGYLSKIAHSCGRTYNLFYEPVSMN